MKSFILAASFAALIAAQSGLNTDASQVAFWKERFLGPLGINCQGGSFCSIDHTHNIAAISRLRGYVNSIDPNHWYQNGEHIACLNTIEEPVCAFLQGTGGMPGSSIAGMLDELLHHGCEVCGSVPVWLNVNGDNNPNDHGILTVNYVDSTEWCGDGLCGTRGSRAQEKPETANRTMNAFAQPAEPGQVRFICTQEII